MLAISKAIMSTNAKGRPTRGSWVRIAHGCPPNNRVSRATIIARIETATTEAAMTARTDSALFSFFSEFAILQAYPRICALVSGRFEG
jgi:hypothetical protein